MPDFCRKFGVDLTNDFIMRYSDTDPEETLLIQAQTPAQSQNRVARAFGRKGFGFYLPRTVRPSKTPGSYTTEIILEATPDANGGLIWADTNASYLLQPLTYVRRLRLSGKLEGMASKDPLPVGVAVADRDGKPRAFVIGDYGFISTSILQTEPVQGPINYALLRSCVEVLVERPVAKVGIDPKSTSFFVLPKGDIKWVNILWVPLGLMVLTLAGTGAGIWIVRRK